MLNRIKNLLDQISGDQGGGALSSYDDRKVAAAALMVEAARMDDDFGPEERAKIEELARTRFELDEDEVAELLAIAEQKAGQSSQLFGFTRVLGESYSQEERIAFIEMLWEVVYADGELHHYEANLMRRIAGLLHVSDRDNGTARKKALARLGMTG